MKKLVRDNIPSIATDRKFRKAEPEEVLQFVTNKITEEALEVVTAPNRDNLTEELADLYEVMRKLARESDIDWGDVLDRAQEKNAVKGSFTLNWILDDEN